jgi:general secretion pathway protein A
MLAALIYGIQERRGFIAIMGEVGTGKTTIIKAAMSLLRDKAKMANIFNTDVTFEQLLAMILTELDLSDSEAALTKVQAVNRLNNFAIQQLAQGGNVALIIDEAQNLDRHSMENLRLLSNLETQKHKLIQIVLSGQPELQDKLNKLELRQFTQRISIKRHITPLKENETYEYISHRLRVASHKGPSLFSVKAQKLIWEYSGGVPRKINILCDNALLIGYGIGKKKIEEDTVAEAIKDLTWSPFLSPVDPQEKKLLKENRSSQARRTGFLRRLALVSGLAIALCLLLLTVSHQEKFLPRVQNGLSTLYRYIFKEEVSSQPDGSQEVQIQNQPLDTHGNPLDLEKKSADEEKHGFREVPKATVETEKEKPPVIQAKTAILDHRITPAIRALGRRQLISTNDEHEKSNPETSAQHEKRHISRDSTELPVKKNIEPTLIAESEVVSKNAVLEKQLLFVVVEQGDWLSKIILRKYGKYDSTILHTVLLQNPDIRNPDLILEGQVIKLPVPPTNL